MMDVPKDISVPRIITIVTATVGHQTRHPTAHPTACPSRAQWGATVAGKKNPSLQSNLFLLRAPHGPLAELVWIEGGVVSPAFNLRSSRVEEPARRARPEH